MRGAIGITIGFWKPGFELCGAFVHGTMLLLLRLSQGPFQSGTCGDGRGTLLLNRQLALLGESQKFLAAFQC